MAKKILIIDDNEKNRKLARVLLLHNGYETIEAEDGKQGIEQAKKHLPDLILMDIQMPVMDGLEATKKLRADEQTKNIPIIAITSYAMKGDREKIVEKGFDAYIPKPIDIDGFIEQIKEFSQANKRGKE
jgi:two-component system cell cycle response regulator DivK